MPAACESTAGRPGHLRTYSVLYTDAHPHGRRESVLPDTIYHDPTPPSIGAAFCLDATYPASCAANG